MNKNVDNWNIEIIRKPTKKNTNAGFPFKSALFDFDGTVSLIREGWQQIMIPYFTEIIMQTKLTCDLEIETECVTEFVDILTGKQTIFQCMRLAEEVALRGGEPLPAGEYKKEYLRRLFELIRDRRDGLKSKKIAPEEYLVAGSKEFIQKLSEQNVNLFLASGTDEKDVLEEAAFLDVAKYFGNNIYGAVDAQTDCSKEAVIKNIIANHISEANELICFGDGFVEIELVKNAGGYAVAVATDEKRREGIDEKKRERLISAGADAVIPDFSDTKKLTDFLNGKL